MLSRQKIARLHAHRDLRRTTQCRPGCTPSVPTVVDLSESVGFRCVAQRTGAHSRMSIRQRAVHLYICFLEITPRASITPRALVPSSPSLVSNTSIAPNYVQYTDGVQQVTSHNSTLCNMHENSLIITSLRQRYNFILYVHKVGD